MTTTLNCQHQPERHRFVIALGDDEAVLEYLRQGGMVDFVRTFVPESGRGQGVAETLVRTGLAWARAEELSVSASCWYVEKWLQRGL
ncbi:GNAT family N-acetyltransferase [Salinispirillum marinum]|uniref:GNAT family N-acetyltransferase n=2 Tax=Saccharospirillaceae TaxID=255527 RepID=A0ABV8BAQ1_9GAMM